MDRKAFLWGCEKIRIRAKTKTPWFYFLSMFDENNMEESKNMSFLCLWSITFKQIFFMCIKNGSGRRPIPLLYIELQINFTWQETMILPWYLHKKRCAREEWSWRFDSFIIISDVYPDPQSFGFVDPDLRMRIQIQRNKIKGKAEFNQQNYGIFFRRKLYF